MLDEDKGADVILAGDMNWNDSKDGPAKLQRGW